MKYVKLFSLVLSLLLTSLPVAAQQPLSKWANVENLKNGTKVVVLTRNGREFIGIKRQATDDSLSIETKFAVQGNRTISLTRDEIAEVRKTKPTWFYPLLGLGVGIAAGAAIGSTADRPGTDDPTIGRVIGGGLGAGIGLAVGAGLARRPGTKTIYVAP